MNDPLPTTAISPLRQRLIDDMNVRRFSPTTQRNYIRDVGRFARSWGARPTRPRWRICTVSRSSSAKLAFRADNEQHRLGAAVLLSRTRSTGPTSRAGWSE